MNVPIEYGVDSVNFKAYVDIVNIELANRLPGGLVMLILFVLLAVTLILWVAERFLGLGPDDWRWPLPASSPSRPRRQAPVTAAA